MFCKHKTTVLIGKKFSFRSESEHEEVSWTGGAAGVAWVGVPVDGVKPGVLVFGGYQ
jgi:hypothetical protein